MEGVLRGKMTPVLPLASLAKGASPSGRPSSYSALRFSQLKCKRQKDKMQKTIRQNVRRNVDKPQAMAAEP